MNKRISKRTFLKNVCVAAAGSACIYAIPDSEQSKNRVMPVYSDDLWKWSKEGMYYEVTPRGVRCLVCPNECILKPGDTSFCRSKTNYRNKLYSIAYGNPCAMHIDPVEKKTLYHFFPGSRSYSIAAAGCNFACLNCQNWSISQASPKETRNYDLMPLKVAEEAASANCQSVSYTYSEPVTFYEYVFDTASAARHSGIKNVLVSNGYINEKPLYNLCKVLDAATIDLKSFEEDTYLRLNAGKLQPVLNSLRIFKQEGVWLEISVLVIPGWSDDLEMIRRLCDWLYQKGFQDNPLHFLRFQPMYKLTQVPPTPIPVLNKAKELALQAGMKYVYIGNIPGSAAINTTCPKCKKIVIERKGFQIVSNVLKNGACNYCGERISGRWS